MRLAGLFCLFAATAAAPADRAVERIARSGRVLTLGAASSQRLLPEAVLAPGDPPLLRFRYLDGKRRGRFGGLDLVMDDAGH